MKNLVDVFNIKGGTSRVHNANSYVISTKRSPRYHNYGHKEEDIEELNEEMIDSIINGGQENKKADLKNAKNK